VLLLRESDPQTRATATRVAEGLGLSLEDAFDRADLVAALDPRRPAVVLLEVEGGLSAALEDLAAIRSQHPACGVILLARRPDLRDCVRAIRAGADDFLEKPPCAPLLAVAVEEALARSQQKLSQQPALVATAQRAQALTAREKDVLRALLAGLGVPETAQRLGISIRTVQLRLQQLLRKLQCPSRQAFIARLLRDPAWRDALCVAVGPALEEHGASDASSELQLLSAGCS
jgi:FixJ family two-component response regulator